MINQTCFHSPETPFTLCNGVLYQTIIKSSLSHYYEHSFSLSLYVGIMLHYATPALNHLYFVDPQWLCDMLAHIVTVPEVNRFIPRQDSELYCYLCYPVYSINSLIHSKFFS